MYHRWFTNRVNLSDLGKWFREGFHGNDRGQRITPATVQFIERVSINE